MVQHEKVISWGSDVRITNRKLGWGRGGDNWWHMVSWISGSFIMEAGCTSIYIYIYIMCIYIQSATSLNAHEHVHSLLANTIQNYPTYYTDSRQSLPTSLKVFDVHVIVLPLPNTTTCCDIMLLFPLRPPVTQPQTAPLIFPSIDHQASLIHPHRSLHVPCMY